MERQAWLVAGAASAIVLVMIVGALGSTAEAGKGLGAANAGSAGSSSGVRSFEFCCGGGGGGGGGDDNYLVYFNETGLPSGTYWSNSIYNGVNWFTSTGDTASVMSNSSWSTGTWEFKIPLVPGYSASPASGNFTVNDRNVYVQISFSRIYYDVYFNETGLPSGTAWNCTLTLSGGGVYETVDSDTTQCVISAPNGGYTWSVGPPAYYSASPSSGSVTVNGHAVAVSSSKIDFTSSIGSIDFTETGMSATTWWVNLSNNASYDLNLSTSGSAIDFDEASGAILYPGVYHYLVGPSADYPNPQSGYLTVTAGKVVTQKVTFSP
jgi:hypothetical protein